jgi:hypothetical protein
VDREVVLEFPDPIDPVRNVRSTLLLGSIATIEATGLMDAYTAVTPIEVRTAITSAVAGMWIPVETALAHYHACDRMEVSSETAAQNGRSVFSRTKGMLLGTAIGLARSSGVTPWTMIPYLQKVWLRGMDGGGIRATAIGPKEARLDVASCPLFETRYFRAGCRGLTTALFELFAQKVYMHEIPTSDGHSLALRAQWV